MIHDVKVKLWVDFTHFFVLFFSEEPLHGPKLGDQPIKIAEILIFNGQNKSTKPQLSAVSSLSS
jgi:hypothetical protein